MTAPERDAATVRFPPPLVFLIAIGAGHAAERWIPALAVGPLEPGWLPVAVGVALVVAGLVPIVLSLGLFRQTGQQPEPWTTTPAVITTGIYAHTRNPMYLGMALIHTGIGVALVNAVMVVLVAPALWAVYLIAVRHEEAYLERKFGDEYRDYKSGVRRWI